MSHDYYETNFTENCYFEIVKGVINTSLRTTDTTQALLNKHRHFSTSECIHSKFHVKLNFVKDRSILREKLVVFPLDGQVASTVKFHIGSRRAGIRTMNKLLIV